ncbi:MAG: insulinase family protein, partial [Gammaproteobacteria bacterium]|nr:insulinase family protein [Gammaproteobacteria bacterium]
MLLISSPVSELASAALAINVGHFDDPQHTQGIAHLLEHMLFLGTEKYPDTSEYQAFIRNHGGQNNAWTSSEHTNYFFSIEQKYFDNALSRFSDFFVSPILDNQSVSNEILTVESEFRLKIKEDNRRVLAVIKESINPDHPFSKFSVGNNQTLKNENGELAQQLKEFYHQRYCAGKMKAVLCANATIAELEKM